MKSNLNTKTRKMCLADSSCFFFYTVTAPSILANQSASTTLTMASDSYFELHRIIGITDADNDFISIVGSTSPAAVPPNIQNTLPNQTLAAPYVQVGAAAFRARNAATQQSNGNHFEHTPNNFSVLMTLQDTGKQLMNQSVPQMALNGLTNLLPMNRPTIFRPQAIMLFDFLNLLNKPITVNLILSGVKIYTSGLKQ